MGVTSVEKHHVAPPIHRRYGHGIVDQVTHGVDCAVETAVHGMEVVVRAVDEETTAAAVPTR